MITMLGWSKGLLLAGAVAAAGMMISCSGQGFERFGDLGMASPRERTSIDDGWRFYKGDPEGADLSYNKIKNWVLPTGNSLLKNAGGAATRPAEALPAASFAKAEFDDSQWRKLDLPHDWGVEGPFGAQGSEGATGRLPFWGTAWYRKHVTIPAADAGKQIFLDVDGAMSYATVWMNGQFVGGWPYGYSSWRVDLTPFIKAGQDNVLAIRVDNPNQSSRWYPGGGIYRNVWLVKTQPVHVGQWGTYVTTPDVSAASATVDLKVTVQNDGKEQAGVAVTTAIYPLDAHGKRQGMAAASLTTRDVSIGAGQAQTIGQQFKIPNPMLWSPKAPQRYVAVTTVQHGNAPEDVYETPFGIRTVKYDPNKGLTVNGEHVPLNGVCDHHDLGALGSAVNTRALERQLQLLQEMGCNAIRTSHNPPAPELLDLADKMGFLVLDEAFDTWKQRKRPNDYHLLFNDWHEQDMRALVRRDRNHPSVVFWSIGNEIAEQGSAAGAQVAKMLTDIVHEEDPTRPTTAACNNAQAGFNGFNKSIDVMGFNYKPDLYTRFHSQTPDQPLMSTESASTISSRGEYLFPVGENKAGGLITATHQMSSYDLYAPRWATTPDAEFAGQEKNPGVMGEFVWTGWDYIGEPTPWGGNDPSRSSYFGIIDLAGFKKDRFFLYQAHWRPDFPMAHIAPHWNWPDRVGEVTPVFVYTSGDEAELFLNGQSLGRQKKGEFEYRLRWNEVKYQPGELKVVAYKNGKQWAVDTVKTTGDARKLELSPDRATIAADGHDLSFVTLTVADQAGLMVPRSKPPIHFEVSGPGEIVATDNGDATDWTVFSSHDRKAFNGLALVIVKAKSPGTITVKATSEGLAGASATITAARP